MYLFFLHVLNPAFFCCSGLSLSSSQSRGVVPVYLRCSQGHVKWSYPRGALRVVLRLPNSDKDFKGCIRVTPNFAGAQLFLVGPRSLTRLMSLNDGGEKQLVRCFQSRNGQAAIYVEAVDSRRLFKKEVAGFSYDLQPIPRGSSYFDLVNEECRPCSRLEMARAFCTGDLGELNGWLSTKIGTGGLAKVENVVRFEMSREFTWQANMYIAI